MVKKKILVTGGDGQLGRAVQFKYKDNPNIELVNTDIDNLDITNIEAVQSIMREVRPYAVINCAAHTGVDACEVEIDNAFRINAIGPRNLSMAAEETGAKMIHISTDYVFNGNVDRPYTEFSDTDPQGIYGKSKLAGENFVRQFSRKYFIIRTAWLYGDGKNFVKTMLNLSENRYTVRVVGDQIGSPTSTKALTDVIDVLMFTDNYGLFHATCEGQCSWADFAKEIFEIIERKVNVEYINTEDYPLPAKRPAYSVLENYMLKITTDHKMPSWKEAIKEYLLEMKC